MSKHLTLILSLVIVHSAYAEEPVFKNARAIEAQRTYEEKLKSARQEYIQELEKAIKEEGGKGNLEEANKISDEKNALELEARGGDQDPISIVRRKLEGTKWRDPSNPQGYLGFLKDYKTRNHLNRSGVWIVTDEHTAVTQSHYGNNIYVFKFDEDLKTAKVYTFLESTKTKPRIFRKR